MFVYEKKAAIPRPHCDAQPKRLAAVIISQYGGPYSTKLHYQANRPSCDERFAFSLLQQELPTGGAEDAVSAQVVCLLHLHKALLHLRAEGMIAGDVVGVVPLVLHQHHCSMHIVAGHAALERIRSSMWIVSSFVVLSVLAGAFAGMSSPAAC